jgi:multidrug resistance protein MdtO
MATLISEADRRTPFLAFLAQELAPREGRGLAVTRIAVATTLTVAIAMVFRIPLAAYMAYLVFLTSKDDQEATTVTAIGGALAVTCAVLLTLGLALVDLGDPAIRLPAMALLTFLAMLSVRTFALGPVSFLAGFIVVTMQSVIDEVPNTEVFTRTALWLWVVVVIPVIVTVIINRLFGPGASTVARRTFRKVLTELNLALERGEVARHLPHWRELLQPLVAQGHGGPDALNPAAVSQLLNTLVILELYPDTIPLPERERLGGLVERCLRSLDQRTPVGSPKTDEPTAQRLAAKDSVLPAQVAATDALYTLLREVGLAPAQKPGGARHKPRQLFVPDALSNPSNWQFALKTTVAVMIVYAVYTMLDWPGLRTSIVTCFFVALGSLGETVHKLSLRLAGALTGGLLAGLCIVFVLPHFTDIGQLCALTALVSVFAGWIATSSERLSYAGLQIAFAFFLGILQTEAPATDLTVLRDRAVGIVLGNLVIALVFTALWPESALTRLRAALSDTLHAIAALLRAPPERAAAKQRALDALVRADQFETLSRFELGMLPEHRASNVHLPSLRSVERLTAAAFVATSDSVGHAVDGPTASQMADWLDAAGRAAAEGKVAPHLHLTHRSQEAPVGTHEILGSSTLARIAADQLHLELARVAATAQ